MNDESRPKAAHETPAKKSGFTLPPLPDSIPLFDVRVEVDAYSKRTRYVPTAELNAALDTAGEFWQATARSAIRAFGETHSTFTIDDLRDEGLVPEPVTPKAWGGAFAAAAAAGDIQFVAYRKSRRRESHSRVISVWRRAQ